MSKLRDYILQYGQYSVDQLFSILNNSTDLTRDGKNIIYIYLNPKPIAHMELPGIITSNRGNHQEGYLTENLGEILILLRAYRSSQYSRFILHLLHSYVQNSNGIYVENDPEFDNCNCGLCGKLIHNYPVWEELCNLNPSFKEQERKEYLAYGNNQSTQHLCLNCMIQLNALDRLLKNLEGSGYLSNFK